MIDQLKDKRLQIAFVLMPDSDHLKWSMKHLMSTSLAIPSQVLNVLDIERSRQALFSYLNHCLFEVCFKIGGIPWAIDDLPFFYEATMVVGYHVSEQNVAFVSSYNSKATKLYSQVGSIKAGSE